MTTGSHRMLRVIGVLAILWAFSPLCGEWVLAQDCAPPWAELTHCTISGMNWVIVDRDSSEGISDYPDRYDILLGYDPATKRLYPFEYYGDGGPYPICFGAAMTLQKSTESVVEVSLQGDGSAEKAIVTATRLCGASGFNRIGVLYQENDEESVAGEGMLVDTDGNRKVDAVLVGVNTSALSAKRAGKVKRLLKSDLRMMESEPLEYYNDGSNDFWHIPGGSEEVFVPVDDMHNLTIQCGEETLFIPSKAFLDSDGNCLLPVPALSGWGAAGLIFLVFVSGIWAMRRTGFGRGLSKS